MHSGRSYRPEREVELLSLEKVCTYLAQGRRFCGVRSDGFFGGGRYQYYLRKHFAHRSVAIRFDPEAMALICPPAELMGELAVLHSLPIYQLALPSRWRPGDILSMLRT